MADPHIQAAFYLSPTVDALWQWRDDGEVLAWSDGTTIAFRAEVEEVLNRLAPGGLPAFGAVVLLLAACREGWMQSAGRKMIVGRAHFLARKEGDDTNPKYAAGVVESILARHIDALVEGLDAVSRLPRNQLDSPTAKALLADVVFEAHGRRSSEADADAIMQAIEEGLNPQSLRPTLCQEESLSRFASEVDGLHAGLQRVDSDALARRAKTGLDETVEPAPDVLPPPDAVRLLLAELSSDSELAGLARLAHDLMAAVAVPRSLRSRDELSIGGVSDLTNRGPLDRLLVSELANDDLTLAVRIAMNEALFLRRESPPREPPHRRAILIDSGVRMWGVPRVFGAAVALALLATNDRRADAAVYRATHDGIEPITLTTRDGLEAHLGELETDAHPGGSLAKFFDAGADGACAQTDFLLITHIDVLSDPKFELALQASGRRPMYVAAIDRTGEFTYFAISRAGRRIFRQAQVELDAVLGNKRKPAPARGVPLISNAADSMFPAILFLQSFPFLLPHRADPKTSVTSKKHGLIVATDDGRLLHWRDGAHGGRQLTSLLPRGWIRGVYMNEAQDSATVLITRKHEETVRLVTATLPDGACTLVNLVLKEAEPKGYFVRDTVLYCVYADRVDGYSMGDGALVATLELADTTQWTGERFFHDSKNHCAIALDGSSQLVLEPVPASPAGRWTLSFDREGSDGIWSVYRFGIMDPLGNEFFQFPDEATRVLGISQDGRNLIFSTSEGNRHFNLETRVLARVGNDYEDYLLSPEIFWSARSSVCARNRFSAISVDERSRICLSAKKENFFSFDLDDRGGLILMEQGQTVRGRLHEQAFNEIRRSADVRVKMHLATWNDGSKAWLDGRGILHLKSSDRSVPEFSLTLSNVKVAAWSSEGKITGPEYFVGDKANCDGKYFEGLLREFVQRLR